MKMEMVKEVVFLNLIASLSDYVKVICEDYTEIEIIEYCDGIICGQLKIANDLKLITIEDVSNIYRTLTDYRANRILPKPLID